MWDDSFDSVPSPPVTAKGRSGTNNRTSLSDVPSSTGFGGGAKAFQKSDQRDIDMLFSPDNSVSHSENNSPDEKPQNRKYNQLYTLNEPTKPENYLANFATTSGDLEDSILGELLGGSGGGGGSKKPSIPPPSGSTSTKSDSTKIEKGGRKLSPAGKLEPLDTNTIKSPRAANSPNIPTKTTKELFNKQPISRFSNDGPITSLKSLEFDQHVHRGSSDSAAERTAGGRAHFNSFDIVESNDDDEKSEYLPSKPVGYLPTKVDSSLANKRSTHLKSEYNPSGIAIGAAGSSDNLESGLDEVPPSNAGSSKAAPRENEKKDEDETNLSFIPSFLDPNRQGRRRRVLDDGPRSSGGLKSADPKNNLNKLDELDAALGLASAPTTGNKKPVDPFAAVEKKATALPTTTGKMPTILADSDSSSDDDLLKPKSRFSAPVSKFGNATPVNPVTSSAAASKSGASSSTEAKKESRDSKLPSSEATTSSTNAGSMSTNSNSTAGNKASSAVPNFPSLSSGSNVVKLPSPEHKPTAFILKLKKSSDDLEEIGIEKADDDSNASDELDISGIIKANDDELARFGLKDTSHQTKDKKKTSSSTDKMKAETASTSNKASDSVKEQDKETEKVTHTGIQLSRKSVGNIRPQVSPGSKSLSSSVNDLKSPTVASTQKLSSSMDEETPQKPPFINFTSTSATNLAREFTATGETKDLTGTSTVENTGPPPISPKKAATGLSRNPSAKFDFSTSSSNLPVDQHDPKIDQILQQSKQEKEKMEKEMLIEIEKLKNKIYFMETQSNSRSQSNYSSGGGGNLQDLENENRILMEQNQRLLTEQIHSKRIISQLEIEVIRLKDESNLQSSKHLIEIKQLQEKHENDLKEKQFKHEMDIETIEKRHDESMEALKEIHAQELQSYKDRSKSNEQLDHLIKIINQTTGSMKFLEEKLSTKHQSIQLVQKGHLDSREKLLVEMEEKAKERIDLAEVEGYKLKGVLLHMETLMNSLRTQNVEEKERLHSEHQRLEILQSSLLQEKAHLQQQMTQEYSLLQQKQKEFEFQQLEFEKVKTQSYEEINHQQHQFELEKRELQTQIQTMKKTIDQKERLLHDEEKRLLRQQEELMNEKLLFQQYKQSSEQELTVLEDSKLLLKKAIEQLTKEKEELYHLSQQLSAKSSQLERKEQELQHLHGVLQTKENVINNSFQEMKIAANELALHEQQLHFHGKDIESKRKDIHSMDQSLLEKKLAYFQQFRDQLLNNVIEQQQYSSQIVIPASNKENSPLNHKLSSPPPLMTRLHQDQQQQQQQQYQSSAQFTMAPNTLGIYQTKSTDVDDISPSSDHRRDYLPPPPNSQNSEIPTNSNWTNQFKQQLQLAYAGNHHPERLLPKEIQSAQKLIKENRNLRQKHSNLEIRKLLDNENSFISNLELLHRQKKFS